MINLVIYKDKPILINKEQKLELLSDVEEVAQRFRYGKHSFQLCLGEAINLTRDIRINFFKVYKNKGISLGFAVPRNTILQRSLGKNKEGRHLWYFRKKGN